MIQLKQNRRHSMPQETSWMGMGCDSTSRVVQATCGCISMHCADQCVQMHRGGGKKLVALAGHAPAGSV